MAGEAAPALERSLSDPSAEVRRYALAALERIRSGVPAETPLALERVPKVDKEGGVCLTGAGADEVRHHGPIFCLWMAGAPGSR